MNASGNLKFGSSTFPSSADALVTPFIYLFFSLFLFSCLLLLSRIVILAYLDTGIELEMERDRDDGQVMQRNRLQDSHFGTNFEQ